MKEKFITISQLAELLGVSRSIVSNWCRDGVFSNAKKEKNIWQIPKHEALEYIKEKKQEKKKKIEKYDKVISLLGSQEARSPRVGIHTDVEFLADFDFVQAKGIDISEDGICFDINGKLPFALQFELNDESHAYRANLIWMKSLPDDSSRLGLEFIRDE